VNGWGRDVLLPFFLSYPSSVIRETENWTCECVYLRD
jgi:hypothetical protein